ncbi:MAG: DEAD/DEAH box helicase family protein [Sterolibacterium sp.]
MLQFTEPTWPINAPRRWQTEAFATAAAHLGQPDCDPAVISAIMGAGKSLLIQELCACAAMETNDVIVVSTSTQDLVESLTADIKERCRMHRNVGCWYGRRKRIAQVIIACVDSLHTLATRLQQLGKRVVLWMADEAHRSECSTVLDAYETLAPAHSLGLTATAFRADAFESITLFHELIYRYGVKEAVADGVVVPWKIVNHDGDIDDLDAACLQMIKSFPGPGLANAADIADAEAFARFLSSNGVASKAVHSRLSQFQKQRIMEDLHQGLLKCVVHVNLLTEGANFPWLCWLQLRREVESRVRFCQEIGRALRSCREIIWPGNGDIQKTEAILGDPHDLFGTFGGVTHSEALGEPPEKPEWEQPERLPPENIGERIKDADPPVAMAWIESVVRTLCVAADCANMMDRDRKPIKKADRLKPSTPIQQGAMASAIEGVRTIAPEGWMKCLEEIAHRPECLRFGFTADLLMGLQGIKKAKTWPPLDNKGRISAVPGAEDEASAPEQQVIVVPSVTDKAGQLVMDFAEAKGA